MNHGDGTGRQIHQLMIHVSIAGHSRDCCWANTPGVSGKDRRALAWTAFKIFEISTPSLASQGQVGSKASPSGRSSGLRVPPLARMIRP